MKYIIDLEPIEGTKLFKAKGFNTLVFDSEGLLRLTPFKPETQLHEGSLVRTPNGSVVYEFKGFAQDGTLNCINTNNGKYVSLNGEPGKYVILS